MKSIQVHDSSSVLYASAWHLVSPKRARHIILARVSGVWTLLSQSWLVRLSLIICQHWSLKVQFNCVQLVMLSPIETGNKKLKLIKLALQKQFLIAPLTFTGVQTITCLSTESTLAWSVCSVICSHVLNYLSIDIWEDLKFRQGE